MKISFLLIFMITVDTSEEHLIEDHGSISSFSFFQEIDFYTRYYFCINNQSSLLKSHNKKPYYQTTKLYKEPMEDFVDELCNFESQSFDYFKLLLHCQNFARKQEENSKYFQKNGLTSQKTFNFDPIFVMFKYGCAIIIFILLPNKNSVENIVKIEKIEANLFKAKLSKLRNLKFVIKSWKRFNTFSYLLFANRTLDGKIDFLKDVISRFLIFSILVDSDAKNLTLFSYKIIANWIKSYGLVQFLDLISHFDIRLVESIIYEKSYFHLILMSKVIIADRNFLESCFELLYHFILIESLLMPPVFFFYNYTVCILAERNPSKILQKLIDNEYVEMYIKLSSQSQSEVNTKDQMHMPFFWGEMSSLAISKEFERNNHFKQFENKPEWRNKLKNHLLYQLSVQNRQLPFKLSIRTLISEKYRLVILYIGTHFFIYKYLKSRFRLIKSIPVGHRINSILIEDRVDLIALVGTNNIFFISLKTLKRLDLEIRIRNNIRCINWFSDIEKLYFSTYNRENFLYDFKNQKLVKLQLEKQSLKGLCPYSVEYIHDNIFLVNKTSSVLKHSCYKISADFKIAKLFTLKGIRFPNHIATYKFGSNIWILMHEFAYILDLENNHVFFKKRLNRNETFDYLYYAAKKEKIFFISSSKTQLLN